MEVRIKQARKALSLSQDEFAKTIGVSTRAVQKWEAGDTWPRPSTLRLIASTTGRPIEWFVGDAA